MEFIQIGDIILKIVKDAHGKYLFPYQIFNRLKEIRPELGEIIENVYPVKNDHPQIDEGAGIPNSPASLIAQALNHYVKHETHLKKEYFDTKDIFINEIVPGNKEGSSIWAWKD